MVCIFYYNIVSVKSTWYFFSCVILGHKNRNAIVPVRFPLGDSLDAFNLVQPSFRFS